MKRKDFLKTLGVGLVSKFVGVDWAVGEDRATAVSRQDGRKIIHHALPSGGILVFDGDGSKQSARRLIDNLKRIQTGDGE